MTAPWRKEQSEYIRDMRLSPRVKTAIRLYGSGAARTKREASMMAGLHPQYLSIVTNPRTGSTEALKMLSELDERINDGTVDMSKVLNHLGRRAVKNIAEIMEVGTSEHIRFKAAQDLADRSPETQKTIRAQVEQFTISGKDAKELARLLVESSHAEEKFGAAAEGDTVKVEMGEQQKIILLGTEAVNAKARDTRPQVEEQEASGVPAEQGQSADGGAEGEAEEGTPQRARQGQEG